MFAEAPPPTMRLTGPMTVRSWCGVGPAVSCCSVKEFASSPCGVVPDVIARCAIDHLQG